MTICCMVGCSLRSDRDRASFFRFPSVRKHSNEKERDLILLRKDLWLTRVGRKDLMRDDRRLTYARICGRHFINGEPAHLLDIKDPDWAPSLLLGHDYLKKKKDQKKKCPPIGNRSHKQTDAQLQEKSKATVRKSKRRRTKNLKHEDTSSDESYTPEKEKSGKKKARPNPEQFFPSTSSSSEDERSTTTKTSLSIDIDNIEQFVLDEAMPELADSTNVKTWLDESELIDDDDLDEGDDEDESLEAKLLVPLQKPEPISGFKSEGSGPSIVFLKKE